MSKFTTNNAQKKGENYIQMNLDGDKDPTLIMPLTKNRKGKKVTRDFLFEPPFLDKSIIFKDSKPYYLKSNKYIEFRDVFTRYYFDEEGNLYLLIKSYFKKKMFFVVSKKRHYFDDLIPYIKDHLKSDAKHLPENKKED